MIFFFFSFSYSAQWKWINFRKNYKLYNMLIQILWIMWVEWIWYFFLITKQLQLHVNIPEWINMILINLHLSHSHINLSLFNQFIQVKHGACQEEFINQSGRKSFYFSFSPHVYFILAYKNPAARITGIQSMFSEVIVLTYWFETAVKPEGLKWVSKHCC